eukprot:2707417-Prymnesium_polylepis.1
MGSVHCEQCSAGKFQRATGSSRCDWCTVGEFQPAMGSSSCSRCAVGQFSASPGSVLCDKCVVGHYQSAAGSSSCVDCPAGDFQSEQGATECQRCVRGHDSLPGSESCDMCAAQYYSRIKSNSSASDCAPCSAVTDVRCARNTTTETLNLSAGYWRHSAFTNQTWLCKNNANWSPCRGGDDAGFDGDGYCEPDYHGVRCELCRSSSNSSAYDLYFDEPAARCRDCGDIFNKIMIACAVLICILLVVIAGEVTLTQRASCPKARLMLLRQMARLKKLWRKAGMRFKLKTAIG